MKTYTNKKLSQRQSKLFESTTFNRITTGESNHPMSKMVFTDNVAEIQRSASFHLLNAFCVIASIVCLIICLFTFDTTNFEAKMALILNFFGWGAAGIVMFIFKSQTQFDFNKQRFFKSKSIFYNFEPLELLEGETQEEYHQRAGLHHLKKDTDICFSDIAAVQLIFDGAMAYEFNLILTNGLKIPIQDHCNKDMIVEAALFVARKLDIPVWSTFEITED